MDIVRRREYSDHAPGAAEMLVEERPRLHTLPVDGVHDGVRRDPQVSWSATISFGGVRTWSQETRRSPTR